MFARFDRTWPSDHDDLLTTDLDTGDFHHAGLVPDLPADQLEWLGDGDNRIHPWSDLKSFDLVAASAAHSRDNGALRAARDVGLIPSLADTLDDVIDFLLRSFLRHIHNHGTGFS